MSDTRRAPGSANPESSRSDGWDGDSSKTRRKIGVKIAGDAIQGEALRRFALGMQPVPLTPGTKDPFSSNWLHTTYEDDEAVRQAFPVADETYNIAQPNIGVLTGAASGGLVVADLDGVVPRIAALALLETDLVDGRAGRPCSHWFYRVKGKFSKTTFKSPSTGRALIELLGDGQQAVIPPSLHESGEYRAWVKDGQPAKVSADELRAAAAKAAAFQEIALIWDRLDGLRHDSALSLIGGLLRANIDESIIEDLLTEIWPSAERNEIRNAIDSTTKLREANEPYSGWRKLRELWGEELQPSITKILEWLGVEGADDERPVVVTNRGRMNEATKEAWTTLKQFNDAKPFLFSQSTSPVRVELDHESRAVIKHLDESRMRYHLLEKIRWVTPTKGGTFAPVDVPLDVVKNVLATPNTQLPPLSTITAVPVVSPSGEIQLEPGYHAENRSYYWPLPGFEIPDVSASPSAGDVARAKTLLMDELLGDFPFEGEAEKANALAMLLLPFGRSVIAGPTPIHFVEAPKPGTGKSKLADIVTRLVCGPVGAASISETTSEEEWRKRLTAMLATGSPFLYIDNITETLASSNIATATTKMQWKDRILGKSEEATYDIRVVWIVTANNASVSADIARRSIRIRLNANVEDPYSRPPESFRHPNLEAWAAEHWGELVWACLTLWRSWVAAGKPRSKAVLGSFEEWATTMGGLLEVAGIPGFLTNQRAFMGMANQDTSRWHDLIEAWWGRHGSDGVRPKELYETVGMHTEGFDYEGKKEGGKTTAFGMELSQKRDTIYGRFKIAVEMIGKKPTYHLVNLDGEKRTSEDWLQSRREPISLGMPGNSRTSFFDIGGVQST